MKYRKKPVIVDAEQFIAGMPPPRGMTLWPDENGLQPRDMSLGYVITIHGQRAHIQDKDWIIMEPDGVHFYPCKSEIFEATYERIT